uniref:Uncharacterized protein n=1 Tax=Chromera velia CCMP2878 TaxID=1169474 RepID=A0A0G4IEX3_9ALVE|eukprot:Cvel_13859.t1-p1 / transcript=Cvel_13859.t1 / gene=Cvel_13859 / organism=Chromera_velia_CCMP2878 / gene_product=Uncharacterized protein YxeH, putative / transcript_product=Uncharacterized protein YxeH, putative / location=Cvel_scaffold963:36644-40114(-) / protein_length=335 / sequence_SO=supercontig / SO=protein_coding / is_pseudo=false
MKFAGGSVRVGLLVAAGVALLSVGTLAYAKGLLRGTAKRRIRLVALDLDGTTLTSSHQLTERTRTILQKLKGKGVIVSLATGRSAKSLERYLLESGLSGEVPVVCYNGACGYRYFVNSNQEAAGGKVLEAQSLFVNGVQKETCKALVAAAEKVGAIVQFYDVETGQICATPKRPADRGLLKLYEELVTHKQHIVSDEEMKRLVDSKEPAKLLLLTPVEKIDETMEKVRALVDPSRYHEVRGSPSPFFIEYLAPQVCKGQGVESLCAQLKVPLDQVLAFGDGDNDVEFLQVAGDGVAMKNAREVTKAAADRVLEWSNDEEGVARELERLDREGAFD